MMTTLAIAIRTQTKPSTGENSLPRTKENSSETTKGELSSSCLNYAKVASCQEVSAAICPTLLEMKPSKPSQPWHSCTIKVMGIQPGASGTQVWEKLIAAVKPKDVDLQVRRLREV